MNKNWIIYLLVILLVIEYKTGYKKAIIVPDDTKITYPTTVIRLKGKARGHKKYIDMRRVGRIFEIPIPLEIK